MTTNEINRTSRTSGGQGPASRVVVEEGADPRLQEWVDQLMADPDDDPDLALSHNFGTESVTAEQVYALLNEFIERRPYGPDNPPFPYSESDWKPGVKLPDDPNEPIRPVERHDPDDDQASRGSRKHNAKHRRLGMFHR